MSAGTEAFVVAKSEIASQKLNILCFLLSQGVYWNMHFSRHSMVGHVDIDVDDISSLV